MIDRDGIWRAYVACGTIMDAMLAQKEDLERLQHPMIGGKLELLHDATNGLDEAASALREFWDFTQECAECDGIIGDAPRAEVVRKYGGDPRHFIIHQSCYRESDHTLA